MADYNFEKTPIGFDVDKMDTDTHLLLEQYHIFSKTPAAPTTALGGARNKAGHTTTASDIWSQDIPAFFKAYSDADLTRFASLAKKNDLVVLAYAKSATEPNGAVLKFTDGAWTKIHNSIASIPDGTPFYNSTDEKPVLRFHQNSVAVILDGDNNNTDGSNGFSAKICAWDDSANTPYAPSALKFVPQFVSPMDKMVNGIPSSGYDAIVKVGQTEDNILAESPSSSAGYIANNYAGIIHFNTARANSTIYVHAFEYIGEKLDATIGNLSDSIKDIVDVSLGEVVANIDTTTAASNAGISVIDTNETGAGSKTSPQIAFTEGSITDTETKLVSGKTVKTYVDAVSTEQKVWNLNQFFNEYCAKPDEEIPAWIRKVLEYKSSDGEQLVYFQQAKKYTTDKISDTSKIDIGENAVTRHKAVANAWIKSVQENGYAPYELVFKKDSYRNNEIIRHMFAQLDKDAGFEYLSDGSISKRCMKPGLSVKLVTVLNTGESYDPFASDIDLDLGIVDDETKDSEKFYPSFVTTTWHGKTRFNSNDIILDKNEPASIDNAEKTSFLDATGDSFMRAFNWTYTVNEQEHKFIVDAVKAGGSISKAIDDAKKAGTDAMTEAKAKVSSVTGPTTGLVTVSTDASTKAVTVSVSDKLASKDDITLTGVTLNGVAVTPSNKVANITAIEGVTTTAVNGVALAKDGNNVKATVTSAGYTAATGDNTVGTWTNKDNVVTGTAVDTRVADAIKEAKAYSNSLHTTSVTYHVTDTLPTVPAGKEEEYKGRIYLVLTGLDGVVAAAGDRIEYMYVQENGVWGWEQIGTTTADLSGYAKTADLNATNVGTGAVKVSQTNGKVSSVTVATEALVSNNAIKTSVTDANALVKAGDALAAIKLAKPESYIKSISATSMPGQTATIDGEVELKMETGASRYDYTRSGFWANPNGSTISLVPSFSYSNKLAESKYDNGKPKMFSGAVSVVKGEVWASNNDSCGMAYGNDLAGYFESHALSNGYGLFKHVNTLTKFESDLPLLKNGQSMFYETSLSSFVNDLPSLVLGDSMFSNGYSDGSALVKLETFIGDLSSLESGNSMFANTGLKHFLSDLSSLKWATDMFKGCKLTTESVECIADTISKTTSVWDIRIDIANAEPNDKEKVAFNSIHDKGWYLYVNGSLYTPTEPSAITTTDENGEVRTTPIPFYAKAVEVEEDRAEYTDANGKFYRVLGGQFIYVNDPETYGMFTCLEDAVANMRLTKYVKPEAEV